MSQSALNGQQFEQLPMFMQTSEVIDKVHKADSALYDYNKPPEQQATPREQWEAPGGSPWDEKESMRQDKLGTAARRVANGLYSGGLDNTPPLTIFHEPDRNVLYDGHHRLAQLEADGHDWVPVEHSDPDNPWV